ncbi:MAG: hypothetical protein KJZ83_22610, partial [Burkholderiaceae bacterium]|nr:hypothetical protein [Burkholderiaceae bacterium]
MNIGDLVAHNPEHQAMKQAQAHDAAHSGGGAAAPGAPGAPPPAAAGAAAAVPRPSAPAALA